MPAQLLPWILKTAASSLVSMTIWEALKRSGTDAAKTAEAPAQHTSEKVTLVSGDRNMSYDLIGAELEGLIAGLDDDELGGIGADGDEALLEALSVSGSGMTEIIGRARRQGAAAAVSAIKQRKGMAVVQNPPTKRRRMPLGFAPTTVAASATGTIPGAPQNIYRTERLMIPSDIAFDLGVTDLKVGNSSQFVQTTEVPAVLFSEVAINTGVEFDTAEVGNQISVSVRNKDTVNDVVFTAAAVGTVAK